MRIKLDENLPRSLVTPLARLGHDVDTVPQEALAGRNDLTVWQAAQGAARFFVTQDLDFSDTRRFRPGTHHGIMLVRMDKAGRLAIRRRLEAIFELDAVAGWQSCFVVVTANKIRVRHP